jgi:transporter family protein
MNAWIVYAVAAAILYGVHQVFTKLASSGASEGLGGLIVEATAAATIGVYLLWLRWAGPWEQHLNGHGAVYSLATGICVGAGTIAFFLLFQAGGPLSAVPAVLALGSAIMVAAGIVLFRESWSWQQALGVILSIAAILLLKRA